jgi:hypothetical protein
MGVESETIVRTTGTGDGPLMADNWQKHGGAFFKGGECSWQGRHAMNLTPGKMLLDFATLPTFFFA